MDSKVEACTSENLPECDWGLIFEIVDDTNVDPTFAREIVRSLRVRLSNPNPKVVQLSLTLYDACIKNGSDAFHRAACGRDTVTVLSSIASGSAPKLAPYPEVATAARKLIAETLVALSLQPALCIHLQTAADTLTKQGLVMPIIDVSTITKIQPPPDALTAAASSSASLRGSAIPNGVVRPEWSSLQQAQNSHSQIPLSSRSESDFASQIALVDGAFTKLRTDLAATRGVIARSAHMLVTGALFRTSSGSNVSANAQSLVDNVDFLGQLPPRLGALIEAGVGGVLDEDLFEECLAVNDAVARVLEIAVPIVEEIEAQAAAFGSSIVSLLPPPSREYPALSDLTSFDVKVSTTTISKSSQSVLNTTEKDKDKEQKEDSKSQSQSVIPVNSLSDDLMGLSFPPTPTLSSLGDLNDRGRNINRIDFEPSPFDANVSLSAAGGGGSSSSSGFSILQQSRNTDVSSLPQSSSTNTSTSSQMNGGIDF